MAEAYKIIIETQSGGSSSKKKPIAGDNSAGKSTQNDSDDKSKNLAGYVAYKKYVAPFVKQGLQYQISTVALRTGDSERQARMQSAYNIGSQILGIGESIAMGYMVGNVAGAVVGAVMSTATTLIGYAQQQNTINLNRALENQQISMLQVRSGATSGNRR